MGLDAFVCCNCIKDGATLPHPFPEMLAFDETAEPILKSGDEISLEQWLKHDAWYKHSCQHAGRIIDKRLGNVARIGHVRHWLEAHNGTTFPLTRERVVYESTHGGDWIVAADSLRLLQAARKLNSVADDPTVVEFAVTVIELAEASVATGNPIVFC